MSNTSLRAVDLNLLVALDLLLDERSVRAAARRARVTPSAMSHTLTRLRAQLGDELLVRAGNQLQRTPRAEAMIEPLKHLLALTRSFLDADLPLEPATLKRAFRVVCTDHVSTVLLPRLEVALRAAAPGVDLYICPLVPETMEDLRRGIVDLAIGVFPEAPAEMRLRRLFEDGFVTVCRPDHPRLPAQPWSLEAFLAEDHALVAPRGVPRGHVDEVLAGRGLGRRVARTFPSFLSALLYVAQSDALLTVSRRLVEAVRSTVPLAVHPPPLPMPRYTVTLTWHPRLDGSREDAWLRGLLVEASEGLAPLP